MSVCSLAAWDSFCYGAFPYMHLLLPQIHAPLLPSACPLAVLLLHLHMFFLFPCLPKTSDLHLLLLPLGCDHSLSSAVRPFHACLREAKRSLLDHFFTELGKLEQKRLSSLLNEDPAVMERRSALAKRLELYRSAQAEIDTVAWSK
ncbi:hypothetical protein SLEP1_g58237 [Rubroshorea leprosula]|uniref:Dynamin GTPase effector domain-containing protein n=1 Tax=Rubroshorea leprosula TaxID=152421 RepID=A0AAV5MPZ5_9ROSI|nr:hypothetical protein SLEP1_g58237 [Rubroshorea leprosula]